MKLDSFQNLLGRPAQRIAAPATPGAGAAWDVSLPSAPTYMGARDAYVSSTSSAARFGQAGATARQGLLNLFQEGVSRDWANASQARTLANAVNQYSDAQVATLTGLLDGASTKAEQVFVLKALAADEPWDNIVRYAQEMRGLPESEIVRRSTMRDDFDVIQQWQDSCGPTLLQTAAGEADPRYAWELNKISSDLSRLDPTGANRELAGQQKQWLEQFGGIAVERGQSGGQGIALSQMLNQMLGPITDATYQTAESTNPAADLNEVATKVQNGYDTPIRISWNQPNSGQDSGHFVLAMAVRGTPGAREFQIHDPWTGKTAWVDERNIAQNSFAPIFDQYARMSHYYPAQPATA
ncbi:hypothetical protein D3C72_459870 [compost metagenome]